MDEKKPHQWVKALLKKHGEYFFLLALLVIVSYANSLGNDFVSDDINAIPGNPNINSVGYIFSNPTFFARSFLVYIAHLAGGLNPMAYRLINIFFHMGNVWLVYIIFSLHTQRRIALLTAMLFAVHPILIESVTWISGGVYSQYTFFLLLSFFLYIMQGERVSSTVIPAKAGIHEQLNRFRVPSILLRVNKRGMTMLLSLLFFLFALSTSEKAAVLPLIIVVYEFSLGDLRKHWKQVVPYLLMVGIWVFILLSMRLTERVAFLESQFHLQKGIDNPIYQIPIAIVSYLRIIFFPLVLTFYHSELQFTYFRYAIYLFFFLIFCASIVIAFKKNKLVFFWLMFFFISLLPTLTPFRISWVVAERYAYPGTIGIIFIFSYLLVQLSNKEAYKKVVLVLSVLLSSALVVRTIVRNIDWKNHDNLWRATIKTSPSSPVAHNNLADVYLRHGDVKNAERELLTAIQLNPNYADAYHNLAGIYKDIKKTDKAMELYKKAAYLNPNLWQSYVNLAALYFDQKNFRQSLAYVQKAIRIEPANGVLYRNLGIIYLNLEEKEKALDALYKALSFKPDDELTKKWIIEASK